MAKGIKRMLLRAHDAVAKEISGLASSGGMYARGLSSEGYAGGYRAALDDVLLALDGVMPNRSYWQEAKREEPD